MEPDSLLDQDDSFGKTRAPAKWQSAAQGDFVCCGNPGMRVEAGRKMGTAWCGNLWVMGAGGCGAQS